MLWSRNPDLDDDLSNTVSKENKHTFIVLIFGNFFRERAFKLMAMSACEKDDSVNNWKGH